MIPNNIFEQVSRENNIPVDIVRKVYNTYWYSIRQLMSEIPIKEITSEELFNQYRTNFNIPSLGKFHLDWNRVLNKRKQFNYSKLKSRDASNQES